MILEILMVEAVFVTEGFFFNGVVLVVGVILVA